MSKFGRIGLGLLIAVFLCAIGFMLVAYGPKIALAAIAASFGPMLIGVAYFLGDAIPAPRDDMALPGTTH